ncbi:unnamed protein product [Phytophthora fragariaefolia]|uniref:Unnamed protein product n=1 Tax=Phytophthora fragariaefolia TaxID=1490495 RepID=A0A9W6XLN6_9STRA|nr:unnamed protein product [Phytophthora fragariaefolia]
MSADEYAAVATAAPPAPGSQRKFGPKWGVKYAVGVSERDPQTNLPSKAVCLMCQAFEREENVGAKRKRTNRIRTFTTPWRPDNMKRHMEQQHPQRWEEYQKLGDAEKRVYFSNGRVAREDLAMTPTVGDVAVAAMVGEPSPSVEAHAVAAQARTYLIDRDIVDELIAGVMFQAPTAEYRNAWNVPLTFSRLDGASPSTGDVDMNESRYVARVGSLLRFNMCLKYVATGISFSQVVPLFQKTAEETGMDASLSGSTFTEQQLACLCRVACAVNLQTLKDALRTVWAFAIAIERGNDAGSPYVDVRMRFEHTGELQDFHLVSVPVREDSPQIIEHQNDVIVKCLDVVAPGWKTQLIGVSTSDSLSTMPSGTRVLVSQLSRDCVASLYCEWGLVQQFEQIIQETFDGLCNDRFMAALTVLTGHFRRQRALIREMNGDVCPKFEENRWRSISKVLKWFTGNRARLTKFAQNTQVPEAPGKEWWVTVLAVSSVMDRVNVAWKSLSGSATSLSLACRECLGKLVTDMAFMSGALGPLSMSQRVTMSQTDAFEVGDFSLSRESTLSFLKEQGSFAITAVEELEKNFPTCCQAAVESTAIFVLSIMGRTHQLVSQSEESSALSANPNTSVPPYLPATLCKTRNQAFVAQVQFQRVRLQHHFTADQIEQIEDQHRVLRTAYQLDENVSQQINMLSAGASSFGEAWRSGRFGGNDCRLLRKFCGAIACAATNPVVRKDFTKLSLINWCKSPFGLSLVDFSLEAALHAKQYTALARLR